MTFTTQHHGVSRPPEYTPPWSRFGIQRCHCEECGFLVFAYVGATVNGNCPECGSSHLEPVSPQA